MNGKTVSRGKKSLWILSILLILTVARIPNSVKAPEEEVRLRFRYPEGYTYYPHQTGTLWVIVDIEAPEAWDNTAQGIVGWSFDVHVDPSVLEPVSGHGADFGYYLFDFCEYNEYFENYPHMWVGEINQPTGDMIDVAEFLRHWTT